MNLILDPLTHAPHLKFLIPKSLYFTRPNNTLYPSGHYLSDNFKQFFNFDFLEEEQIIKSSTTFNHLFIILPVLSTEKKHQGDSSEAWIELYNLLYNSLINKVSGKVIVFDNHGGDYEPTKYLSKFNFKYDIIFKRVYSKRNLINYKEKTYTYPFIMDTNNDPMYNLYNKQLIVTNSDKIKKCLWSGSLIDYHEEWDDNNEHGDRRYMLNAILNINPHIVDQKNIPYSLYLTTLSTYKYILDLRGTSRLNKRFYEILSTNTLLLAERLDVIFPFDEEDKFSEECFFSNATEFYNNYLKLENNPELYNKCLENQKYIVKKYFNNNWLWNYINTKII